jgi:tyrosyl-tRNA synthetase
MIWYPQLPELLDGVKNTLALGVEPTTPTSHIGPVVNVGAVIAA